MVERVGFEPTTTYVQGTPTTVVLPLNIVIRESISPHAVATYREVDPFFRQDDFP